MPFELSNQGDYLLGRLFGVITPAELERLANELEILEDSIPTAMNRITDLTAVERFAVGFSAISAVAVRRRSRQFSRSIKSALIARGPVQFGLARMFQTLNDNAQIEIRILESVTEAKDWVAEAGIPVVTGEMKHPNSTS